MKIPQIKPDWNTGIYIGNGVVAKPKDTKPVPQWLKKAMNNPYKKNTNKQGNK
tara:strand:- start:277 stop:435 length:159 start_codon:yes stop_codon:yes gene_type:complete